jgi:hypothetical protein
MMNNIQNCGSYNKHNFEIVFAIKSTTTAALIIALVLLGTIAFLNFFTGCRKEHRTGELPFSLISSLLSLIPPGEYRDNILQYVTCASSHTLVC